MKKVILTEQNKQEIINKAVSILKMGGLVIVPSDTVYGVSVDSTNEEAVNKLISFKSRPPGKAISVFCGNFERLSEHVRITASQEKILRKLLPGAYTIVLPSKKRVSPLIESETGMLGVRVPDNVFVNELVNSFGKPLTATSANNAGQSPHYSIEALLNSLSEEKKAHIDLVIDAGKLPHKKPSAVVDMSGEALKVLRAGEIAAMLQLKGDGEVYDTSSEEETISIARTVIGKFYKRASTKPLVFLFTGTLGAGKTVFIKSMAIFLGVNDIVSPTFVVYYEYDVAKQPIKKLVHADLYRITDNAEFAHLGLENYLKPHNLLCIEWGEKSQALIENFEEKADCIFVNIEYTGPSYRRLTVHKNF